MKGSGAALLLALLAGNACESPTDSSGIGERYALHRIGNAVLPVPLSKDSPFPRLLADSLTFPEERSRDGNFIFTRVQVFESSVGQSSRSEDRYPGVRNGNTLLLDSCPVNSFCIASLVYAPLEFRLVGDSLVQQLQPDQPQEPMVYGRVR